MLLGVCCSSEGAVVVYAANMSEAETFWFKLGRFFNDPGYY